MKEEGDKREENAAINASELISGPREATLTPPSAPAWDRGSTENSVLWSLDISGFKSQLHYLDELSDLEQTVHTLTEPSLSYESGVKIRANIAEHRACHVAGTG